MSIKASVTITRQNQCVLITRTVSQTVPGAQCQPDRQPAAHLQSAGAARHQSRVEEIPLNARDVKWKQQLGPIDSHNSRTHYESLHVVSTRWSARLLATTARPPVPLGDSAPVAPAAEMPAAACRHASSLKEFVSSAGLLLLKPLDSGCNFTRQESGAKFDKFITLDTH